MPQRANVPKITTDPLMADGSDMVEPALATPAEPDDFADWLVARRGALDPEFALAV